MINSVTKLILSKFQIGLMLKRNSHSSFLECEVNDNCHLGVVIVTSFSTHKKKLDLQTLNTVSNYNSVNFIGHKIAT